MHVDVPAAATTATHGRPASCRLDRRRRAGRRRPPTFTLYRMRFTDAAGAARDLVGVLGGLEVVDEGAGGVLPHERTTPKASTDRLDLTRATDANLSPVWGLSLAGGLTTLLAEPGEPVGAVVVDGVEHASSGSPTRPGSPPSAATSAADDVLIADGHHRYGDRPHLPRRGPRHDGPRRHAGRADPGLRRRAGRRAAQHRGHPPPVPRRAADDLAARVLAHCFDLRPAPRPRRRSWPDGRRGAPGARAARGRRRVADPRPGAFDGVRAAGRRLARARARRTAAEVDVPARVDEVVAARRRPAAPTPRC